MSSSLANIGCFLLLPFSDFQLKFSFKLKRNEGVYYTTWKTMKHARQKILWLTSTKRYFNLKQFWLIVIQLAEEPFTCHFKSKDTIKQCTVNLTTSWTAVWSLSSVPYPVLHQFSLHIKWLPTFITGEHFICCVSLFVLL